MSPADPAPEPYFALADELDVPVGLHMGEGPQVERTSKAFHSIAFAWAIRCSSKTFWFGTPSFACM